MPDEKEQQSPGEMKVTLKDIVLSNSWALQAILQYLEEMQPGARDRIWEHYILMKDAADRAESARPQPDENGNGEEAD